MSDDLQINTPQALVQCQNVTVTWTGGVGMSPPNPSVSYFEYMELRPEPYYVGYIASGTIQTTATYIHPLL